MGDGNDPVGLQEDLISVGCGDRAAFRRLYDASAPKLFAICLHVIGDRASAEEVLQEVFVKVWRSASTYDHARARPLTWMCAIARNAAIDRYRRRQLRPRSPAGDANFVPDEAEPVDQRMLREEAESLAFSLVAALDDDDEDEIRKIYFDGLTFVELAERENKPLGTVKSKVRRIVMRLRQKFQDE